MKDLRFYYARYLTSQATTVLKVLVEDMRLLGQSQRIVLLTAQGSMSFKFTLVPCLPNPMGMKWSISGACSSMTSDQLPGMSQTEWFLVFRTLCCNQKAQANQDKFVTWYTQSLYHSPDALSLGNIKFLKRKLPANFPNLCSRKRHYLYYPGQQTNLPFASERDTIFIFQNCLPYKHT